jgi:hypothetical protein
MWFSYQVDYRSTAWVCQGDNSDLIGGHRHGIDTIRLQIMTVARWATLARRLQSA